MHAREERSREKHEIREKKRSAQNAAGRGISLEPVRNGEAEKCRTEQMGEPHIRGRRGRPEGGEDLRRREREAEACDRIDQHGDQKQTSQFHPDSYAPGLMGVSRGGRRPDLARRTSCRVSRSPGAANLNAKVLRCKNSPGNSHCTPTVLVFSVPSKEKSTARGSLPRHESSSDRAARPPRPPAGCL